MVTLEVSSVQCEETVKYPCPRPVVLGILGAMALLLALWWSFVREGSEAVRQPLEENIMEPSEMREDVTEEVDDTEHLYLEQ